MNLETEINRELWQAVRRSYESGAWTNAVLDSVHFLSDALRSKTGLQSDGIALVGQALGRKAPKLRLNRLETESEKNVQSGVEQLLRGVYQAIRNPRSHERVEDTQADADAIILFVGHLLKLIGHARSSFSIEDCVNRITEQNFVPNQRYATLLVEEIPARQRLQVALSVLQQKASADGQKLRFFFDAVLAVLPEEQQGELLSAISAELRESSEESALRCVLQMLNEARWPLLDEVARLRTENRILRNLQDGRYDRKSGNCLSGALATWSRGFCPNITLKAEMLRALVEKLRSSSIESQDYVLQFWFGSLDLLADSPTPGLQNVLSERLAAGDERFKQALDKWCLWRNEKWNEDVQKAIACFQAAEPAVRDDEIPF